MYKCTASLLHFSYGLSEDLFLDLQSARRSIKFVFAIGRFFLFVLFGLVVVCCCRRRHFWRQQWHCRRRCHSQGAQSTTFPVEIPPPPSVARPCSRPTSGALRARRNWANVGQASVPCQNTVGLEMIVEQSRSSSLENIAFWKVVVVVLPIFSHHGQL